jgi:flagellar biosynthesis GTPase FlhF
MATFTPKKTTERNRLDTPGGPKEHTGQKLTRKDFPTPKQIAPIIGSARLVGYLPIRNKCRGVYETENGAWFHLPPSGTKTYCTERVDDVVQFEGKDEEENEENELEDEQHQDRDDQDEEKEPDQREPDQAEEEENEQNEENKQNELDDEVHQHQHQDEEKEKEPEEEENKQKELYEQKESTEPTRADFSFPERHSNACLVGCTVVNERYQPVYETTQGQMYYINSNGNKSNYIKKYDNRIVQYFDTLERVEQEKDHVPPDNNCTIKDVMKELREGTRILMPPLVVTSFGGSAKSCNRNTDLHVIQGNGQTERAAWANKRSMEVIEHLRTVKHSIKDKGRVLLFDSEPRIKRKTQDSHVEYATSGQGKKTCVMKISPYASQDVDNEIYKDFEFLNSLGFRQGHWKTGQPQMGTTPNREWEPLYRLALRAAAVAVFFISHRSVASKNCKSEVQFYKKMRDEADLDPKNKKRYRALVVALHKHGSGAEGFQRKKKEYESLQHEFKTHPHLASDGDTNYFEMHQGAVAPSNEDETKRLVNMLKQMKLNGELVANVTPREYTDQVIEILEGFGY